MKILISDDEEVMREVLHALLSKVGECEAVDDGEKALAAFIKAHEEGRPFDVLFLDIVMPRLSGHHVLQAVREYEHAQGVEPAAAVKVIMSSALDDAENVVGAFKSGCEAYLTKPIAKRQIFDELRKLGFEV